MCCLTLLTNNDNFKIDFLLKWQLIKASKLELLNFRLAIIPIVLSAGVGVATSLVVPHAKKPEKFTSQV